MTKKNIATVLCLLLVLSCVALRVTRVVRGSEPDQLIGSWSLVSRQTTLADGKVVGDLVSLRCPKASSFMTVQATSLRNCLDPVAQLKCSPVSVRAQRK